MIPPCEPLLPLYASIVYCAERLKMTSAQVRGAPGRSSIGIIAFAQTLSRSRQINIPS